MKQVSENLRIVKDDILRYKKNTLGQWLTYCGLVFACLYIMLLYAFHNSTFNTILMGASVLLTLVILLTAFLCAEGVKAYNKKFCIVLLVLAVIEIVRIFIYPSIGWNEQAFWYLVDKVPKDRDYLFGIQLSQAATRALLIVYLVISAAFFAAAAVYSYIVCMRHENFNKKIAEGSVNVELALKALEEEELAQANAAQTAEEVQ